MSIVEDRIVEMKFDNRDFVNNVNATLPVLDKLTNGIKGLAGLPGSALNGLTGITASVKALPGAVLSATAQVEIMHRALNTVLGVAENLKNEFYSITFDQIGKGFDKYGEKTTSVQTIMAATGKSITEVEKELERLTWFSDETSYSFTDMVSNVGKFTSQGIDLETAVTQMQGIATWAAKSGQNAQTASRAMYNISQAMGTGAMMTKDWMSIENANMATAEFKQLAIDTAVGLGKIKKGQVTIENFRDSLSKKWFDTDVMSEVFKQYGGYADAIYNMSDEFDTASQAMVAYNAANKDAVGSLGQTAFLAAQEAKTFEDVIDATKDAVSTNWMNVWQNIFGNYEEARVLWTDLANRLWDVFAGPISTLNDIMTQWHDLGGRSDIIDIYHKLWDAIFGYDTTYMEDGEEKVLHYAGVLEKLKQAVFKIIPGLEEFDGMDLKHITDNLQTLAIRFSDTIQKFQIKNSIIDKLATVFQGLMAVFNIGKKILGTFIDILKQLSPTFEKVGNFILDTTVKISEFFIWLDKSADEIGLWKTIANGVVTVLTKLKDAFVIVFTAIGEAISKIFPKKDNGLEKIADAAEEAKDPLDKLGETIENIAYGISDAVAFMTPIIINAIEWIKTAFNKLKTDFSSLGKMISNVWESIKNTFSSKDGIQSVGKKTSIDEIIDKLSERFEKLKGIISTVIGVGAGGGLLAWLFSIIAAIKNFDWGLGNVIDSVSNLGGVKGFLKDFGKNFKGFTDVFGKNGIFGQKISDSISNSLNTLSKSVAANNLKTVAASLLMLAGALFIIALLPYGKIIASTVAIGALGEALYGFLYQLNKEVKGMNKSDIPALLAAGAVMLTMAGAIGLIALALMQVSLIGDRIWAALGTIGTAFISLGIAVALLINNTKGAKPAEMLSMAAVVIALSAGLLLIAKAIKILGRIKETDKMVAASVAIVSIMGALSALVIVMGEFSNGMGNDMLKAAGALVVVSGAIAILAGAIGFLTILDPEKMGQAALAIVAILAVFALIIAACSIWSAQLGTTSGILIAIGSSLILISGAFYIFAAALAKIASVLGVLATIFTIFSSFDEGLGQKFSDFLDMMIEKIPDVINAFLVGLAEAPVDILFGIINSIFEFIMSSIETWVPRYIRSLITMGNNIGDILVSVINQFEQGGNKSKIFEVLNKILGYISEFLDKAKDKIKEIVTKIISNVMDILKKVTPEIIPYLKDTLVTILAALTEKMPEIWEFIKEFVKESIFKLNDLINELVPNLLQLLYNVIDSLLKHIPDILVQSITVIGALLGTLIRMVVELFVSMAKYIWDACLEAMDKIIALLDEYKDPLINKLVEFLTAITELLTSDRMDPLIDAISEFIKAIADFLESDKMDPIFDAIETLIDSLVDLIVKVITRSNSKMIEAGVNLLKGLTIGMLKQSKEVLKTAWSAGGEILKSFKDSLRERSPSKATKEMGEYLMDGLAIGIKDNLNSTLNTVDKSGTSVLNTLKDTLTSVGDYVDGNMEMNPTITPVLDLSNVRNNIGSLSSMFGTQQVNAIATGGGFTNGSMMGTDINAMSNMMQKLNDKLDDLHVTTSATPVEVNVNLEGDTNKLFKAMVDKNNDRIRATGFNQFTRRKG